MSAAAVSAPLAVPKAIEVATGFAVLAQPIALTATSPLLAGGTPLTVPGPTAGSFSFDPATAKAGFTFGALLYRNDATGVSIYDGNANWIPETAFDPADPALKPSAFAFDQTTNAWTGTVVLSTVAGAAQPGFATDLVSGKPTYGFIAIFLTPPSDPTTAIRSPLGTAFGISASDRDARVKPVLVQGTTPTQDPKSADGFGVFVNDGSHLPVADLIVSSDTSLPQTVVAHFYAGGVLRASIALEPSGNVHLSSATQVTLDAPLVVITGKLQARTIEYVPFGGSTEEFL
jgi:hypothetical protein